MLVASLAAPLDVSQCGGKAFPLQRLVAEGWRVPPGFVVTTKAFELFRSAAIPAGLAESRESLEELSPANMPMPPAVVAAIREALTLLGGDQRLAVRSSAVGEDSREAAFAGLLETRLNVEPTLEMVLEAIQHCWLSYNSPRVRQYQASRGKSLQGMAVIVQQLVIGAYSGVMFTRHPAPNHVGVRENSILVEYCPGLGDDLVAGRVTPVSCVIPRSDASDARETEVETTETDTRDSTAIGDDASRSTGRLPEHSLAALRLAADRLECLFGCPQDVEWTCDAAGEIYWLQSRPVTTLGYGGTRQRWTNANLNENYPEPVTPLLASLAQQCYYHYFRNLGVALGIRSSRIAAVENELRFLVGTHAGRLYYNLSNIERVLAAAPFGDWLVEAFLDFIGADDQPPTEDSSCGSGSRQSQSADRPSRWRRLRDGWETARILGRASRLAYGLQRGIRRFELDADQFATQSHPAQLASQSWDQLLALWRGFATIRFHRWLPGSLADAASMVSYALLKRTLQRNFPEQEQASLHNGLLRGLREVVSVGPAESLWEISRLVRSTPDWNRWLLSECDSTVAWEQLSTDARLVELRDALTRWLDEWGFRCSGELLLTVPSYQEQPRTVVDLLKTYARLEGESPGERLDRQARERSEETERTLRALAARPLVRGLPWPRRDAWVRRLVRMTQKSIICRERARLKQALLYQRLRRLSLEIGARFQRSGIIEQLEDIFFLTWQEVESLLAGGSGTADTARRVVEARKSQWRSDSDRSPPRELRLGRGESWKVSAALETKKRVAAQDSDAMDVDEATQVLRGVGACGGVVEGRACVLEDVRQIERLAVGDILVVRQTDPGWATVFPLVRGLVMERGGMLSHGAILAREYGLPTVVGIENATERLAHHPQVRVDGNRGEVQVSSPLTS